MQLFYETLRKGVNQLIGDPNYEATQWLNVSYCQKTTLQSSSAWEEDSKWEQMIYL